MNFNSFPSYMRLILLRKHIALLENMLAKIPPMAHLSGSIIPANPSLPPPLSALKNAPLTLTDLKIAMPDDLDQEDHDEVPFWTRLDWFQHESREKDGGIDINKLYFLTDDSGNPPSSSRLREFWRTAKAAWIALYQVRQDPESWGKKTPLAADYFYSTMKNAFPEFRYCENNWKADQYATYKFPDWKANTRNTGKLKSTIIALLILLLMIFLLYRGQAISSVHFLVAW